MNELSRFSHMTNNRVSLFWLDGDHYGWIGKAGIYRIMRRGQADPTVIFQVQAEFLNTFTEIALNHTLRVAYYEYGPLNNPTIGDRLFDMTNIRPTASWINHLSPLEYSVTGLLLCYVSARCEITPALANWWGEWLE
jgi:hypothetical protein